jgi:hypothetical protein
MAYTRAQTPAIALAAAHTQDANQQFAAHHARLRATAATHINNPATWATPGAGVMAAAMQAIDAELTKVRQSLDGIGLNLNTTHGHYTNGVSNETALVNKFASMLNL